MTLKENFAYLVLLAFAIVLPLLFNTGYIMQLFIMILLFAYLACCWNIIGGFGGQFALGNGVFIGIGAYVTAVLFMHHNLSPWLGMIIAGIIAGIISLIIGYPCFKLNGSYFALASAALLFVIQIIVNQEDYILGYETGGAMGLKIPWHGGFLSMQFVDKIWYYYIILGMLILILLITSYISKSKMGYYLLALNTNQIAAGSLGINVTKYKLLAQFMSAFFTAIGGAFYCMLVLFIDTHRTLGFDLSIEVLLLAVVGGAATVWGPVIGAVILVPINEFLRAAMGSSLSGLSIAIYGIILMLVVYFMPEGLIVYIRKYMNWVKDSWRRKKTAKTSVN